MSAADPTAQELLTAINAAIYSLVTKKAQSVSVNGRQFNFIDLGELRKWRTELSREVTLAAGGGIRIADVS